jgi:hypothetical protein
MFHQTIGFSFRIGVRVLVFITFIGSIASVNSCKTDKPIPATYQADTLFLQDSFRVYCDFKDNSYWVYQQEDSIPVFDTVLLKDYERGFLTINGFDVNQIPKVYDSVYKEYIQYSLVHSYSKSLPIYNGNDQSVSVLAKELDSAWLTMVDFSGSGYFHYCKALIYPSIIGDYVAPGCGLWPPFPDDSLTIVGTEKVTVSGIPVNALHIVKKGRGVELWFQPNVGIVKIKRFYNNVWVTWILVESNVKQ